LSFANRRISSGALHRDPAKRGLDAEVLYDEIRELGYRDGRSILKEFMHPFRSLAKEKATVRFETPPGHQGQVDWESSRNRGLSASRVSS